MRETSSVLRGTTVTVSEPVVRMNEQGRSKDTIRSAGLEESAEYGARMVAATGCSDDWAHVDRALLTKPEAAGKRNVARRRNLAGDTAKVPLHYNANMEKYGLIYYGIQCQCE